MLSIVARSTLAVLLAATLSVQFEPAASAQQGYAKYYSQGIFNTVAARRNMRMRQDVQGYAAVPDCSRIGQVVRASINGSAVERYHILDCSAPRDLARHRREGLVIEVDYQSAVRHGFVRTGRARATVFYP
jgi:hypothetical protein